MSKSHKSAAPKEKAPAAPKEFDVETLHKEAMIRHNKRMSETKPSATYDVNVKESYKKSMALIEAADIDEDEKEKQIAHLESVLSEGECRYA
jgi:hypothetical protein